jgi:magnesium transporter
MGKSSGYLLHTIIDALVDDLFHILMKVIGNLDDIEDAVYDAKTGIAREISHIRREITTIRRVSIPLKRIIVSLTRDIQKISEEDLTPYFDDIKDHIDKVLDTLEEAKETIEIYKDTDYMLSTEKTNKIIAMLTVVFTLSIPITIISTIYGMNISLPGSDLNQFQFLGEYTTLILIMSVSIVITGIMFISFRRLGWLARRI